MKTLEQLAKERFEAHRANSPIGYKVGAWERLSQCVRELWIAEQKEIAKAAAGNTKPRNLIAEVGECDAPSNETEMLETARVELEMLRNVLGVSVEPHQTLFDRMIEAAQAKRADGRDAAWSDLKIAFDIPDGEDETLWKCVESGAITLPNGWKLIETTGAGGVGPVAVFRTEHLPTSSEAFVVGSAINCAIAASKEKAK